MEISGPKGGRLSWSLSSCIGDQMVCLCQRLHLGKMSSMDLFHSAVQYSSDCLIGVCDCLYSPGRTPCALLIKFVKLPQVLGSLVPLDSAQCYWFLPAAPWSVTSLNTLWPVFPVPQGLHLSAPLFRCCRGCSVMPNKIYWATISSRLALPAEKLSLICFQHHFPCGT